MVEAEPTHKPSARLEHWNGMITQIRVNSDGLVERKPYSLITNLPTLRAAETTQRKNLAIQLKLKGF